MSHPASASEKAGLALHHNGAVDQDGVIEHLVGSDPIRVAIHYANVPSFDKDDPAYGSDGRTALKYLIQFGQRNTPICAHYAHLNGEAYVGTLSDDFTILVVQGGSIIEELDAVPGERIYTAYDGEDVNFLKTAAFETVVKITEDQYPILFEPSRWNAGKAFHPWDSKREILTTILNGGAGELTAETLPWPLAEKLVEEYLRHELVPGFAKQADGRGGRETIDLLGFDTAGDHVVVQTTTATETGRVAGKATALRDYVAAQEPRYGYLFALESTRPDCIQAYPDIEFVALEDVLSYCRQHPSIVNLLNGTE